MPAASPTSSKAGKENDTAEQLHNLKRRGTATVPTRGLYREWVYELSFLVFGAYKSARSEASKQLHVLAERLRRVPGRIDTAVTKAKAKAREELSQLFWFTLKKKGVVPDSTRDLINDLVALDGVRRTKLLGYSNALQESWELRLPGTRRIALCYLSSDGTIHKNINFESRRATVINQNNEKQHFFLGIGMAINYTSEKQLEGWEDLIETAPRHRPNASRYENFLGARVARGTNNSAHGSHYAGRGGRGRRNWLGEEEHRARHNATLTDFVREISQEGFDKLSDPEKQDVDLFMWCGFIDATMTVKLYNRDNAAAVSLADGTGAAARAEDRACGGAIKAVILAGAVQGEYRAAAIACLLEVSTPLRRSLCLPGESREPEAAISDFLRTVKAERRAFRGNLTRNRFGGMVLKSLYEFLRPVLCAGKDISLFSITRRYRLYCANAVADWRSQIGALVDTIHGHNDESLLASLAHGHDYASAAISQLQQMAFDAVFRASETTSRLDAVMGNAQIILSRILGIHSLGDVLVSIFTSVLLARLHMLWTHTMIAHPTTRSFLHRMVPVKQCKPLILPSLVFAAAQQATFLLPLAVAVLLGLPDMPEHALHAAQHDEPAKLALMALRILAVPATAGIFAFFVLLPTSVAPVCGDLVANKCKTLWGLDSEGEIKGVRRDTGIKNLWYMVGSLAMNRFHSKHLALRMLFNGREWHDLTLCAVEIKAIEENVFGTRFSLDA
ncbi:hypothetical protein DFH09DRAFT_1084438 [Mycena vulgaris]|nr:hypothetical protein DFH09DRAFT_1084438 [Mycena vulgaris]